MRRTYLLHLLLLTFCLTLPGLAQSTNATISGQVTDPSGRVVPDADIQVLNEATGEQYTNKTNNSGIYNVSILPPGQYRVQVSKDGFKTLIKPDVVLNVHSAVAVNFALPLGAASESITVDAGTSLINTTDGSISTVVNRKYIEHVPLNGQSFKDLISMTVGVVTATPQTSSTQQGVGYSGDFSISGQRTASNSYSIDGVTGNTAAGNGYGQPQSATGGTLGGTTALGTTQVMVPLGGLAEFRVLSSSYAAEYGRSPGGQFSLVTRSGTNNLHGSLFDYLRNNYFDANNWFNNHYGQPTPALRQNDFGGTLGGPVWLPRLYDGRQRTFFFGAYEGLRLTQPTAASIQYVPDSYMRQQAVPVMQPILNAFPLANGIDYGSPTSPNLAQFISSFSLPSSIDSISLRADHRLMSKLNIFFRYGNTQSSTSSRPNFALLESRINAQTFTLGASSQLSQRITNEFRLGYNRTDAVNRGRVDDFGGASPIDVASAMGGGSLPAPYPGINFSIDGIGSPLFAVPNARSIGRQWNIVESLNLSAGRHQIKMGIDYLRIKSPLRPANLTLLAYFLSPQAILRGTPDIPEILRYVSATPVFNDVAAYIQDEWHATPRIVVSVGVRWELAPPPTEAHGNDAYTLLGNISEPESLSLAPQGAPLWRTTWFNFAPRVGIAWTAHNIEGWETVLHAGGGVFYDTLNQVATGGYQGVGFTAYKVYSGASLPFPPVQLDFPVTATPPYTGANIFAFPEHLQLPYTLEWNANLQQALGKQQALTIAYVGANGRRLASLQQFNLTSVNPQFGTVYYYPGGLTSNYQAFEVQFQRSVSPGLQVLAGYTWAHSIDFGSESTALSLQRGNSNFDVRNNLQGGLSWDLPKINSKHIVNSFVNDLGIDGRLSARSAFPVSLNGATYADTATGNTTYTGLNVVPGVQTQLYRAEYPGGRAINKAAFAVPKAGLNGNAPRNFLRGFGATQINLAVRHQLRLKDSLAVQFRAEAFNLFNHPNFGYVDPTYSNATFGQATQTLNQSLGTVASQYQQGGPRSMQLALKILF